MTDRQKKLALAAVVVAAATAVSRVVGLAREVLVDMGRIPSANVPCREIPKALLPSCERRRPHGSSDDAFGLHRVDRHHPGTLRPDPQPLNS